jgi:hypothetical protein
MGMANRHQRADFFPAVVRGVDRTVAMNPQIGATMASAESTASSGAREPDPHSRLVRTASGIYGLIVAGSVLASVGAHLSTGPLVVAVFVTTMVYWLSEQYAELVEHASAGHLPTWSHAREALRREWPVVSASYIPVATLLVARLFGATPSTAALIALFVIVVMLIVYGWSAGRASGLHGFKLLGITLAGGGLGLLMILLKVSLAHFH